MKRGRVYRGVIVVLVSLLAGGIAGPCRAQQAPVPGQQQPQLTVLPASAENKISLDIKGMEVVDVLKMLSLRSGLNIVAGKNVKGKVTIYLKDVDIMEALETILISNELAYDMKGSIINVMTDRDYEALYGERFLNKTKLKVVRLKYCKAQEVAKALNQIKSRIGKVVVDDISNTIVIMDAPQAAVNMEQLARDMDSPTQTRVFALNYSKAETMKTKLEPLLTKGIGTIQIDERTNKVIVTDLTANMKIVEQAVTEFDEKTKEVLIDAKILQITLTDEYQAGINWDAIFAGIKTQLGMNFNVLTGSPIPTTSPSAVTGGGLHVGSLDLGGNYEAMVKFLQTFGKTNLLAGPRIVAVNNEEAKILVGKNQPYATSQTTTPATGAATTSYQITFLDLGVKLYVTPTINRDGYVTMKVKPEVSSTTQNYSYGPAGSQTTVPIVNTSQAETTVMVKDGNTIVIAGLIESRDQERVDKVPGLGDAPLIGPLFRSRTKGSVGTSNEPEKNELVIFLTPHIISGDAASPEVERYEDLTDKLERQLPQKEIHMPPPAPKPEPPEEITVIEQQPTRTVTAPQQAEVSKKTEQPPSDISVQEYYEIVRRKVLDTVRVNYPKQAIKGEVQVDFWVRRDGTLKGTPAVLKPVHEALQAAAIASVEASAPFPSFPKRFTKSENEFKITIVYE